MSKKNKLTIGFAGTPELAYRHFLKISESSDIDIRFVLTQPDKKTGRGQKTSNSLYNSSAQEVEILQPDNLNDQNFNPAHNLDDILEVDKVSRVFAKKISEKFYV